MIKVHVLVFILVVLLNPVIVIAGEWEELNTEANNADNAGQYHRAFVLAERALNLAIKNKGLKHPDTLSSMNYLGLLYQSQGYYEKAKILTIETLALMKEVLGLKHSETLTCLNNLAYLYHSQGLFDKAEPIFIESLALTKETLGLKHPDTLASMSNLANLHLSQGQLDKAEPLAIKTVTLSKEALGLKHLGTIASMDVLARLYQSQGQYEKAEPIFVESLVLTKEMLGLKHPNTLTNIHNLAWFYQLQGNYKKAELLTIESLTLSKETLGLKHPSTLASMNNLGLLYYSQDRYKKAEHLFIEALALHKEILGLKHPNTLTSMNNLALLYYTQNHYEKAEFLFIESLVLRQEILGLKHPETLNGMSNLAWLYKSQEHYKKAEDLLIETLALSKEGLGLKHPATLDIITSQALLYQSTRQWEKAQNRWAEYLTYSDQFLDQVLWGAGEKTRLSYIKQQEFQRGNFLSLYSYLTTKIFNNSWLETLFSDINPAQVAEQAWKVSISRKGLLLHISSQISALSKINQSNDPELTQLTKNIKQARNKLSALVFSTTPYPKKQAELEEELNTLQRQLGTKVSHFKHQSEPLSSKQLLSALTDNQTIIDYLVFKEVDLKTREYKTDQVIAIVASSNQGVQLIKLGELSPISQLIQTYRNTIEPKKNDSAWFTSTQRQQLLSETSKSLYQKLWQPLIHTLSDTQQVFLIPDGVLHLLPFKALQDEHGDFLTDKINITRLGSARDIVLPPIKHKTTTAAIFANPNYGEYSKTPSIDESHKTVARNLTGLEFETLDGTIEESYRILETMEGQGQQIALFSKLKGKRQLKHTFTKQ